MSITEQTLNLTGIPATDEQKKHGLVDVKNLNRLLKIYEVSDKIDEWELEKVELYFRDKADAVIVEFIIPHIAVVINRRLIANLARIHENKDFEPGRLSFFTMETKLYNQFYIGGKIPPKLHKILGQSLMSIGADYIRGLDEEGVF